VVGGVLGAILVGVVGSVAFPGGSPLMWASLGAVVGVVIPLLSSFFSEDDEPWLFLGLMQGLDASNCCGHFAILIVAGIGTIGGLLLWHNWLLAALAGASVIVMILISWFFVLLKHLLAKKLNSNGKGSVYANVVSLQRSAPARC